MIEKILAASPSPSGAKITMVPIKTQFGTIGSLSDYILNIYDKMLYYGVSVAVLIIVFQGYTIMASAGNPESVSNAKKVIVEVMASLVLLILIKLVIDAIWHPFNSAY